MMEERLADLEGVQSEAYQALQQDALAYETANEKLAAAEEAFQKANMDLCNDYDCRSMKEKNGALIEAQKALEEAKEEVKDVEEALEESAEKAQEAADAVKKKKMELRRFALADTSYVVHQARIECSFGIRDSLLVLEEGHGVKTRQYAQMTEGDCVFDKNIINFGGCKSKENPSTQEAARQAVEAAQAAIEKKRSEMNWFEKGVDWVANIFVKDQEIAPTDDVAEQCVGECLAEFPPDAVWNFADDKVTINGEKVLLRRCYMMCNHGGRILILLCGQPE